MHLQSEVIDENFMISIYSSFHPETRKALYYGTKGEE
jgi:hypothetical protein